MIYNIRIAVSDKIMLLVTMIRNKARSTMFLDMNKDGDGSEINIK